MSRRDYYEASRQRLEEATWCHAVGRHGLALTQAGLAAECMLRAFLSAGAEFDGRHDLVLLLRESAIWHGEGQKVVQEVTQAVRGLGRLWRNSYRYLADRRQNQIVKALSSYSRMRGEGRPLKQAAADALELARRVVLLGEKRWQA